MIFWYKQRVAQMSDLEMVWLQKKDCAAAAVWEWIKGDCYLHNEAKLRVLSTIELSEVAQSLGIDSARFSKISKFIQELGWVTDRNEIRGWSKWRGRDGDNDKGSQNRKNYQINKLKKLVDTLKKQGSNVDMNTINACLRDNGLEAIQHNSADSADSGLEENRREEKKDPPPTPPVGGASKVPVSARKKTGSPKRCSLPDDWKPHTKHEEYAAQRKLDLPQAVECFRGWAIADDKQYANWDQTFFNAMREWLPQRVKSSRENNPSVRSNQTTFSAGGSKMEVIRP